MRSSTLRRLVMLVALLGSFSISRVALAQTPQLIVGATVNGDPIALAWAETNTELRLDPERAKEVAAEFVGTEWAFNDNSLLVITKNAEPYLSVYFAASQDRSFFVLHGRGSNFQVDGKVVRNLETKAGYADIYLTVEAEDGKSSSTVFIQMLLKYSQ